MIGEDGRGGRLGAGVDGSVEARFPLVAGLIVLVFIVFAVRLFQLQIIEGEDLSTKSKGNSVRLVRLEAPRGEILDRHGRVLATTRPAFGLQVMPSDLRRRDLTFQSLAMLLDGDAAQMAEQVGEPKGRRRFQPVRLSGDLSYDRMARVESHLYALPGVMTDVRPRRDYLYGEFGSHLLGYTGEVRRDQLETRAFGEYRAGEVIGQSGVENLFEAHLRGREGGRNVVVDVAGRVVDVLDEVEPEPGGALVLTIDRDLQLAAEEGFLPDVLGGRPKRGAVVALDPRNGDVLVLVSKPSFDPNDFAGGIDTETWRGLSEHDGRPLQNRAIAGQYPPGSLYKVVVASAGLQERLVDPAEPVYCPGSFKLGRRTYRCWKRSGHGWMDLHDALVQSCDVYFYQLGLKLGIDRLAFFARGFSLGRRTGIDLAQEMPGLVPTRQWKERRFGEVWMKGETVSAAIGQGFNLVTPLQVAVSYAALANGGKLLRPRILLERRGERSARGPRVEMRGTVPVDPARLARVRAALVDVVEAREGTGGRARVPGVRVGGKTGTAQVVRLKHTEDMKEDEIPFKYRDHAWFAAFAPVEDPEIVVVALVEHGGHGGSAAGPIAQRVIARHFENKLAGPRMAATMETGLAGD